MERIDTAVEVRPAAAARVLRVLGDDVAVRGEIPGSGLVIVDVTVAPGAGVPPHRHASPETFRVLAGRLTVARTANAGVEEVDAGPGDIVAIPGGVLHGYRNAGTEPASFQATLEPELLAFFLAAAAEPIPAGPPSPETAARIFDLARRHGIEIAAAA